MVYWNNVKNNYSEETYKKYLKRIKRPSQKKHIKAIDKLIKNRKQPIKNE